MCCPKSDKGHLSNGENGNLCEKLTTFALLHYLMIWLLAENIKNDKIKHR